MQCRETHYSFMSLYAISNYVWGCHLAGSTFLFVDWDYVQYRENKEWNCSKYSQSQSKVVFTFLHCDLWHKFNVYQLINPMENIILLSTHCLFNGPLEYNSRMLEKLSKETQLSKHPNVIFRRPTKLTLSVE
jgi:hypothetical protein